MNLNFSKFVSKLFLIIAILEQFTQLVLNLDPTINQISTVSYKQNKEN